jgi:hypothetical protein
MFSIKTNGEDVKVSIEQIFDAILQKSFSDFDKNKNLKNLNEFIDYLNKTISKGHLHTTHSQLYSVYFLTGYYYRLFLEKNNVSITNNEDNK